MKRYDAVLVYEGVHGFRADVKEEPDGEYVYAREALALIEALCLELDERDRRIAELERFVRDLANYPCDMMDSGIRAAELLGEKADE